MIIDSHVHLLEPPYNEEIGLMPLGNGSTASFGTPRASVSPEMLLKSMDKNKVEKSIVVAVANLISNENLYEAIKKHPDRFIGFCQVEDPLKTEEAIEQLEYAVTKFGMKGLKLYNEWNNFTLSDQKIVPLVEKTAELDVPVYCHSVPGGFPGYYYHNLAMHFDVLSQRVPDAKLIIGHMGYHRFMDIVPLLDRPNVFTESSWGLTLMNEFHGLEFTTKFIRKLGIEQVLYGSDWLGAHGEMERQLELLEKLDLTREEKDKILRGNISNLLNL